MTVASGTVGGDTLRVSTPASEPIAIIGIGCRFPAVRAPTGSGFCCARAWMPSPRCLRIASTSTRSSIPSPDRPGRISTHYGAFVDGVDRSDLGFFGLSPRQAQTMDPAAIPARGCLGGPLGRESASGRTAGKPHGCLCSNRVLGGRVPEGGLGPECVRRDSVACAGAPAACRRRDRGPSEGRMVGVKTYESGIAELPTARERGDELRLRPRGMSWS